MLTGEAGCVRYMLKYLFLSMIMITQGQAKPAPDVVLQILDKVTAREQRLHIIQNTPVEFGTLRIVVHRCHRSSIYEVPESAVYLEIWEQKALMPPERIFEGWMFSSPVVSLEHPIYDVRVISCGACTTCCHED
jgi:hypothetical protein